MFLQRLAVTGLRNLDAVDIHLAPGVNLFYGINGSGKTSLLESVYLLSRGRSFRTRNLRSVINHQLPDCTCFGSLVDEAGRTTTIGVNRTADGEFLFKVGGEPVRSASRLSETLPVQLLNSDSFQLLEGPSSHRRAFLDWGVFHVEQEFRHLWSRFQRCLKHRNSLLRHGRIDPLQLAVWDREFVQLADRIADLRALYTEDFQPVFNDIGTRLGVVAGVKLNSLAGWDRSQDLEALLRDGLDRDRKAGHTQLGPHRADLRIQVNGRAAAEVLSRGQAKVLVTALKLAQGCLLRQRSGRHCIYLLDDLPAELDPRHRAKVGALLRDMGVQVLVTGVEQKDLLASWPPDTGDEDPSPYPRMFHVEQGRVLDTGSINQD